MAERVRRIDLFVSQAKEALKEGRKTDHDFKELHKRVTLVGFQPLSDKALDALQTTFNKVTEDYVQGRLDKESVEDSFFSVLYADQGRDQNEAEAYWQEEIDTDKQTEIESILKAALGAISLTNIKVDIDTSSTSTSDKRSDSSKNDNLNGSNLAEELGAVLGGDANAKTRYRLKRESIQKDDTEEWFEIYEGLGQPGFDERFEDIEGVLTLSGIPTSVKNSLLAAFKALGNKAPLGPSIRIENQVLERVGKSAEADENSFSVEKSGETLTGPNMEHAFGLGVRAVVEHSTRGELVRRLDTAKAYNFLNGDFGEQYKINEFLPESIWDKLKQTYPEYQNELEEIRTRKIHGQDLSAKAEDLFNRRIHVSEQSYQKSGLASPNPDYVNSIPGGMPLIISELSESEKKRASNDTTRKQWLDWDPFETFIDPDTGEERLVSDAFGGYVRQNSAGNILLQRHSIWLIHVMKQFGIEDYDEVVNVDPYTTVKDVDSKGFLVQRGFMPDGRPAYQEISKELADEMIKLLDSVEDYEDLKNVNIDGLKPEFANYAEELKKHSERFQGKIVKKHPLALNSEELFKQSFGGASIGQLVDHAHNLATYTRARVNHIPTRVGQEMQSFLKAYELERYWQEYGVNPLISRVAAGMPFSDSMSRNLGKNARKQAQKGENRTIKMRNSEGLEVERKLGSLNLSDKQAEIVDFTHAEHKRWWLDDIKETVISTVVINLKMGTMTEQEADQILKNVNKYYRKKQAEGKLTEMPVRSPRIVEKGMQFGRDVKDRSVLNGDGPASQTAADYSKLLASFGEDLDKLDPWERIGQMGDEIVSDYEGIEIQDVSKSMYDDMKQRKYEVQAEKAGLKGSALGTVLLQVFEEELEKKINADLGLDVQDLIKSDLVDPAISAFLRTLKGDTRSDVQLTGKIRQAYVSDIRKFGLEFSELVGWFSSQGNRDAVFNMARLIVSGSVEMKVLSNKVKTNNGNETKSTADGVMLELATLDSKDPEDMKIAKLLRSNGIRVIPGANTSKMDVAERQNLGVYYDKTEAVSTGLTSKKRTFFGVELSSNGKGVVHLPKDYADSGLHVTYGHKSHTFGSESDRDSAYYLAKALAYALADVGKFTQDETTKLITWVDGAFTQNKSAKYYPGYAILGSINQAAKTISE